MRWQQRADELNINIGLSAGGAASGGAGTSGVSGGFEDDEAEQSGAVRTSGDKGKGAQEGEGLQQGSKAEFMEAMGRQERTDVYIEAILRRQKKVRVTKDPST